MRAQPKEWEKNQLRVVSVGDDGAVHRSVRTVCNMDERLAWAGQYWDAATALREASSNCPHIIVLDQLSDMPMTDCLRKLKAVSPAVTVIAVGSSTEWHTLAAAIVAGANGYVAKTCWQLELPHALAAAARGEPFLCPKAQQSVVQFLKTDHPENIDEHLTLREKQVLSLEAQGFSYKQIAARLHISIHTVNNHLRKSREKLGAHSAIEAIRKASLLQE